MLKKNIWSGLTAVFATLLAFLLVANSITAVWSSQINEMLGASVSMVVTDENASEDTDYYPQLFDTNEELIAAALEQNYQEMAEGATLLKNDNNALPLSDDVQRISVFGHAAVDSAYQSNSAGEKYYAGSLNTISLPEALEAAGFELNQTLLDHLSTGSATRGDIVESFGGVGMIPTGTAANSEENAAFYEEVRYSWQDDYNDAAIVIFAREGAEGTDLAMQDEDDPGGSTEPISQLALHQNERDLLEMVREDFDTVIVLLNTNNQMEVEEIKEYCDAILWIGFPGQQGFQAVADILAGEINPSGHLVDTYAVDSLSAPATVNSGTETPQFSNADEINATIGEDYNATYVSVQVENIYIGYRYYETRYADSVYGGRGADAAVGSIDGEAWDYSKEVSYTFGYGLSYTQFEQTLDSITYDAETDLYTIQATVTNVGDVAGKSVVQLYAQTPYGTYEIENLVEKSAIQLAGFAKTDLLDPGESEQLTITVDRYLLASYDENAAKGYILSAGDYYFAIGDDAHDALNNILALQGYTTADGMTAEGDATKANQFWTNDAVDSAAYQTLGDGAIITNRFDDIDINYWLDEEDQITYISRSDWAGTYPTEQTIVEASPELIEALKGDWYETPEDAASYAEVEARFNTDSGLTLIMMKDVSLSDWTTWENFIYQLSIEDLYAAATIGNAPLGDLVPALNTGDGIDSFRDVGGITATIDGEETTVLATRYCSKPILTATFNVELYAGRGRLMGAECNVRGITQTYNIGVDLHRTPFGGRSFEYMSECPTMSYLAAIPEVEAMEEQGVHAGPKHVAGNDQEFQRQGVAAFSTEQAFREGSLRAVEGAMRVANSGSMMQSYHRIGALWATYSYALNTGVFRLEWGWEGNIVTDMASLRDLDSEGTGYMNHTPEGFAAGSNQWWGDSGNRGTSLLQIAQETDDGYLVELLVDSAIYWCYAAVNSNAINGMSASSRIVEITPFWQTALVVATVACAVLTVACAAVRVVCSVKKKSK